MPRKRNTELKPQRGEMWTLHDGSDVQILEKQGGAWKVLSTKGTIVIIYESQLARRHDGQ